MGRVGRMWSGGGDGYCARGREGGAEGFGLVAAVAGQAVAEVVEIGLEGVVGFSPQDVVAGSGAGVGGWGLLVLLMFLVQGEEDVFDGRVSAARRGEAVSPADGG
jgi:hypothetical protein